MAARKGRRTKEKKERRARRRRIRIKGKMMRKMRMEERRRKRKERRRGVDKLIKDKLLYFTFNIFLILLYKNYNF